MVLDDLIVRTLETCRTLLEVIRTLNLHYHTGFTLGGLFLHDSNSKFLKFMPCNWSPQKMFSQGNVGGL